MKILELDCDPWRDQHFTQDGRTGGIDIPVDDSEAYAAHPGERWVYDKLLVARSQGLECGNHDVEPPRFPIFSKPLFSLEDSGARPGVRSRVLFDTADLRQHCRPGHFWMRFLTGDHISSDFSVIGGEVAWCRHGLGIPDGSGTFDYWVIEERARPRLERYCADWIRAHLPHYTGMVNLDTIGGIIIDVRLRFAQQWSDLYGRKWLDAMFRLYHRGSWDLIDTGRAEAYSVVLYGPLGVGSGYPHPNFLSMLRTTMGISSVQLTFLDDQPPDPQNMPAGGFRLAIINSFNLEVGLRARTALGRAFGLTDVGSSRRVAG